MASSSGFQSILQQWKQFDLTSLQKELDETAAELANRQDESENSRKKLVDQSRDFKKNTPEEVRKQVTPLLKCFQAEIDSLSKRSKAAEASFLTLYKKIIEAPDPVPAMDQVSKSERKAQRCSELELENENLRLTLDQYNTEFAEVRNQEVTIRQLKERIKVLEEQTDSIVEARVAEQETASKRFYEERERQLQEENESLSQKLKEAEERANAVQTSLNAAQSELFVLRSRGDELGSAKASELELILSDVERANQRADTAEKECELLKEKIQILAESGRRSHSIDGDEAETGDEDTEKKSRVHHELELVAKDKQIGQLLEELKQVNGKLIDAEKRHQSEWIELTQELETTRQRYYAAESSLKAQSDYDEIKRELNILKAIELGADEDDEDSPTYDGVKMAAADTGKTAPKRLEMLLLEKNKALQDENASLRNSNRELNVQPAGASTHLPSFCRDPSSDDRLNALIASVSEQRVEQNNDDLSLRGASPTDGLDSNGISDLRKKKEQAIGAPLQNVVKRMACLIGTELVAMYQATEEQSTGVPSNNIPMEKPEKPIKPASESRRKSSVPTQVIPTMSSPPSPPNSAMSAMAMDLLSSLRNPTPAGFEEALASGVPREIVEYVALHHLQQSVAKKVRESAAAGEILDTANVAQRCRIALSTHNIGQRLLAKCILNQSQGSVSELLSKPKPWEKLTEKGKESFRRIQAWLSDESSIELLRMISPKRAYGGFRERYPPKQEDSSTQDKINAILSEAQSGASPDIHPIFGRSLSGDAPSQVVVRNSQEYSPDSRQASTPNSTTAGGPCSSPSKTGTVGGGSRSSGRYRHDDIPKEMVFQIYQRELEKLQAQETVGGPTPTDTKPPAKLQIQTPTSAGSKAFSNPTKRFQAAFSTPQSLVVRTPGGSAPRPKQPRRSEPKRLSGLGLSFIQRRTNQQTGSSIAKSNQLLAMRQRSAFANNRRAENRAGMRLPPVRPSWSASRAKLVSPGVIRVDDSPVASVLNALKVATSSGVEDTPQSFSPGGTPIIGTKAFKAILPPISQEQFEEYNNIDTEDLVRKVKDYLTKYSISQRLFGEQVLGLSQGSVSDLLARPKLWSMLTQKGREPFIRMQLFLSDKVALQKLMEKRQQQLQSQGGNGESGDIMDSISGDELSTSGVSSSLFALPVQSPPISQVAAPANPVIPTPTAGRSRRKPAQPRASAARGDGNRPRELSGIAALLQVAIRGGNGGNNDSRIRNTSIPAAGSKSGSSTHPPRRYIPASAIPEPAEPIDTADIVNQVKGLLMVHNIGQKVFGATVLSMSQGAVSDLLSKTKPWELLSARGREAMLRMKAWLDDPNRLEKVFQGRTPPQPKAPSLKRPATDTMISSGADFFSGDLLQQPPETKKVRVVLTDEQKHILRSAYEDESYPSSETVNTLARQLGLSVRTVVNWFHNRRMRSKPPPGTTPVAGQAEEADDTASDDGLDASAYGGDIPDQCFSYEDELAFAHAELERLATEEDGVGIDENTDVSTEPLHPDDSAPDWANGGVGMENLGWTGGDYDEPNENGGEGAFDSAKDESDYDNMDGEGPSKNDSDSIDNGDHESPATVAKPRLSLLERLEQYVKREDPSWDADADGRTEAIARLERSLTHEDNTEWEF